jgi:hypothetical protein
MYKQTDASQDDKNPQPTPARVPGVLRLHRAGTSLLSALLYLVRPRDHHSGIALLTPEVLHYGRAEEVIRQRQQVLNQAYARNPERFVRACPNPLPHPTVVWINPPMPASTTQENQLYYAATCL